MKTLNLKNTFCFLLSMFFFATVQAQSTTDFPIKPEVVFVKGGTFTMGSKEEEDETPHKVTLNSYSIGKYPVTAGQYKAFCEATGRRMPEPPVDELDFFLDSDPIWIDYYPIVRVSYNDAEMYCKWLSEKYGGDWRLPTEAEWEYAARGGNKSKGYPYSGGKKLEQVASRGEVNGVGRRKSNELGVYDMSGNVWEYCSDWYEKDYYSKSPKDNPKGPVSGNYRVVRGGSSFAIDTHCRVANRSPIQAFGGGKDVGFRVALSQ